MGRSAGVSGAVPGEIRDELSDNLHGLNMHYEKTEGNLYSYTCIYVQFCMQQIRDRDLEKSGDAFSRRSRWRGRRGWTSGFCSSTNPPKRQLGAESALH